MALRVSNTQRSLYLQCGKKYYYRYKRKMRVKAKGSALFFGTAFDQASDVLFHEKDLKGAKEKFDDLWMVHEQNLNCKFSKSDMDYNIIQEDDFSKLTASADNLNNSKAKQAYEKNGDTLQLVKDIKKMKDNGYTRELTLEEERFLHYAHILSMRRKGYLMLEAFHRDILPHVTEVISTQMKVDIANPEGDTIIGYIDLLCKMEGYKLPNGRVLTDEDIVVADVKTAGVVFWKKLDNLAESDQLDTYVCSPQVQEIAPTNLVCYMAVSKQVSKDEKQHCTKCGTEKTTRHKTCAEEVDGSRCGGEWKGDINYFCESKIVIGERNIEEAQQVYNDYSDIVHGIKQEVFPRNRDSCNAYGGVCEFKDVCGKYYKSAEEESEAIEDWKERKGEK